jgi:diaminopimelate decarboxylase
MLSLLRRWVKPSVLRVVHRRNERRRRELAAAGQALQPSHWGAEVTPEGDLSLGGCRLADVAARFGTPLQVVHEDRLVANARRFRESFATICPRLEFGFSYKTNPLPGALRILHAQGLCAEVISHFELWLALRLGVPPERIVFNGPGKPDESLRLAAARGVKIVNLDNVDEAARLQHFAKESGRRQAVGLRIVTSVGWSAQFGVPLRQGAALAAFDAMATHDHLVPRGLHLHLGTGIKNVAVYAQAVDEAFAFAKLLKATRGVDIDFFDLGGGFGVPTVGPLTAMDERLLAAGYPAAPVDVDATPPLAVYAEAIGARLRAHFGAGADIPTIFFEPGRAVSSSAQTLLLRVLAVKPGPRDSRIVILDGGHNLALPTGYEMHELLPVAGLRRAADTVQHFYGPLCHPSDIVARGRRLPVLRAGDVVAVMDAGAYFIPNQMNFSNPRSAAVIVKDGTARLTRGAESFERIVALDDGLGAGGDHV